MGLTMFCKKTGTEYRLGYMGFMMLRMQVATCLNSEYGEEYGTFFKTAPWKRNCDKLNLIATRLIREKSKNEKIVDFLAQDDIGGKISYGAAKVIYDTINGKCEDFKIGYSETKNPFTWQQFIDLLKECYEHKSDLVWR